MNVNTSTIPQAPVLTQASQLQTGTYYPFRSIRGAANTVMSANTLYGVPLLIPRNLTVDRIAIDIQSAGAGGTHARLGIYYNGTNMYPGALLLDAGTVVSDATGVHYITISQALPAGLYWGAIVSDGAPTVRAFNWAEPAPLGLVATDFSNNNAMWSVAFNYAVLPATFTAAGSAANNTAFNIALRILSLD